MIHNSKLAVGVHMLAYLAFKAGKPVTSAEIASSVGTNPVVIRRLISALRKGRLVAAQEGAGGGFTLASAPENITLLDVYRAVEPKPPTGLNHFEPCQRCPVGAKIGAILQGAFFKAQAGMEAELQRVTIADMDRQVRSVCPHSK